MEQANSGLLRSAFQNLTDTKNIKGSLLSLLLLFILSVGSMSLFENTLEPFEKASAFILFLIAIRVFMNWGQSESHLVDSHLMTELRPLELSGYYALKVFFRYLPALLAIVVGLLVGGLLKGQMSALVSDLPKLTYQIISTVLAMLLISLLSNVYLAKPTNGLARVLPLIYLIIGGSFLNQGAEGLFTFLNYTSEFAHQDFSTLLTTTLLNIALITQLAIFTSDLLVGRFMPFKKRLGFWGLWLTLLLASLARSKFGVQGFSTSMHFLFFISLLMLYSPLYLLERGSFPKDFSLNKNSLVRYWLGGVLLYGLFLVTFVLVRAPADQVQYYDQYLREFAMFAVQSFVIFALFEIGSLDFNSKNRSKFVLLYFVLSVVAMLAVSSLLKDHTEYTFTRSLVLIPGLNGMHEANSPLPLIFTWAFAFHLGLAAITYFWWKKSWNRVESSLVALSDLK